MARTKDSLKHVTIQFMPPRCRLDHDQQATQREAYQTIDEAAVETDRTNERGAHPSEQDKEGPWVDRRAAHEIIKEGRSVREG